MGLRALLLIALVALGLFAVLQFTDEKPAVARSAETAVLGGRSLLNSKRIRWQFHENVAFEVGRDADGRFMLAEPLVDVASVAHMKQIVDAWDSAQMQASKLANDEAGRAEAGLSPPELVFSAMFEGDREVSVEIGGIGPLADKDTRYLRVDGRIWVASNATFESMRVGLDDLRERMVFRHAGAHANEVRVEQKLGSGKREALHLRLVDGAWRLLAPVEARADPVAAQRLVSALLALRVTEFVTGVLRLPPGEPDIEVSVEGVFGTEALQLWTHSGSIYGLLPGRNIAFSSDNREYVQVFEQPIDTLRARILLPLGTNILQDMLDIQIDPGQGGDRLRLTRQQTQPWRLQEPLDRLADPTPCNELAEAMTRLIVREFVTDDGVRPRAEDPRYGLIPAQRWTLLAQGVGETKPTQLWFGAEVQRAEETLVYCCRADEPDAVVLVSKEWVERLRRPWLIYCQRDVLRLSSLVERLELRRLADGAIRVYALANGQWRRDGEPTPRPEVGELANEYLRDLVADHVVEAKGDRFRAADWELELQAGNQETYSTLRFYDLGSEQPLLVQGPDDHKVALALKPVLSGQLRALWQ